MRPHRSKASFVVVVAALMVLSPTAGVSQSEPSNDAVLGDCPSGTIRVTNLGYDYKVKLDKRKSVANSSGVLCRYANGGGVSPFIEIHWSEERGPGEAGACDDGPGGVLKDVATWKSRNRMVEAAWSGGIKFKGGDAAEKKLVGGLVRKLEGQGVGGPCVAEHATPPDSGDTGAASVSVFPPENYCTCPTSLKAFRQLQRDYDADEGIEAVRDAARLVADIKASREFEVRITSKHDETLKARVIWTGSPWRRLQNFESELSGWQKVVGTGVKAVGAFTSLQASLKSIINTFRELGQDKEVYYTVAVEEIVKLHAETKQAVRLAEEVQDRLYCANGLGIDIAMVALANATKRVCVDQRTASQPKQWARLAREGHKKLGSIRRSNVAGNRDILELNGTDAVQQALAKCERLGVEVTPYPVNPLPMAQCEAGGAAGE